VDIVVNIAIIQSEYRATDIYIYNNLDHAINIQT
jgi:hypothetical protein